MRRIVPLVLVAAFISCDGAYDLVGVPSGIRRDVDVSDAVIRVASGNRQEAEVGTVATDPLVVQVLNGSGSPLEGAAVVWDFAHGGGAPPGDTTVTKRLLTATDTDGHAIVQWSLGTQVGNQVALARVVSPANIGIVTDTGSIDSGDAATVRFRATATPGLTSRVSASPEEVQASPGQTVELQARAEDRFGNQVASVELEWASSDERVARVSEAGVVYVVAPGNAEIIVKADQLADTTVIRVEAPALNVSVRPNGTTLSVGDTLRFDASILDGASRAVGGAQIRWSSSDTSVLRVDSRGLATARGAGIAAVIATTDGGAGEAQVTVVSPEDRDTAPGRVTDLRVTSTTREQATLRWTAVADGVGGSARYAIRYGTPTIRWWAAYETEVSVAGRAPGQRVEFTVQGLEPGTPYQFQVVSYRGTLNQGAVFGPLSSAASGSTEAPPAPEPDPVASIRVDPSTHTFTEVGQTRRIQATGRDSNGREVSGAEFRYTSSNPSVVSVDAMGRMTANAAGAATIAVSSVCCSAEASVSVRVEEAPRAPVIESVTVTPRTRTFTSIGETARITATGYDGQGNAVDGAEFAYRSTNPSIVSVDDMGRMTARATGTTTILVAAICCSAEASIAVQVERDSPPPRSQPGQYNEPSGMSVVFHADGRSKNFSGISTEPNIVVVADPDAPHGSAVEWRWPNGAGAGASSHHTQGGNGPLGGPAREIYYRMVLKHNPRWVNHSGGDKLMYFGHVGKSSSYFLQLRGGGQGSGDYRVGFQNQTPTGGNPSFIWINDGERFAETDGEYHVWEVHMVAQSSPGASDGQFYLWYDGELKEARRDMRWVTSGSVYFEGFQWYPYWGGSGSDRKSISPYDWMRFGELYVSGKR